jgi:hypothetical protein
MREAKRSRIILRSAATKDPDPQRLGLRSAATKDPDPGRLGSTHGR